MDFLRTFLETFIPLFVAIDPFGMVPVFLGVTEGMSDGQRRRVTFEAVTAATIICLAFMFLGEGLFRFLGLRDFLNKNGVTCTVESVPKVAGDKLVVVGVRGFAVRYSRLPEYGQYMETILGLGQQFAGRVTYDRFKPTMFKWE